MKYWNKQGKYQKLYDQLYKELVPTEGKADTEHGETLRVLSNVYYDIYNNGGANLDAQGSKYRDLVLLGDSLDDLGFNWGDKIFIMSSLECYDALNQVGRQKLGIILDRMVDFVVKKIAKDRGLL